MQLARSKLDKLATKGAEEDETQKVGLEVAIWPTRVEKFRQQWREEAPRSGHRKVAQGDRAISKVRSSATRRGHWSRIGKTASGFCCAMSPVEGVVSGASARNLAQTAAGA